MKVAEGEELPFKASTTADRALLLGERKTSDSNFPFQVLPDKIIGGSTNVRGGEQNSY